MLIRHVRSLRRRRLCAEEYAALRVIPYWRLTAPRFNMHHEASMSSADGERRVCDCTHYCYSPLFYEYEYDMWWNSFVDAGLRPPDA